MTVVDLTRALLRCRSVTPDDAGAIDVVAQTLADAGFVIHRQVFSEPGTPDIVNLYARIGTASPVLLFAGHTDVVPPGDTAAWRFDPFAGTLAEGFVWGRGAVDMKGGIAAFVAATLAFLGAGQPAGSIAFLITGDEEGPAINGTPKLLDWAQARGERFDACILGEPTNPDQLGTMAKVGRRGSLSGTVVVAGRQGHVAYPHLADNPIPTLARLVAALADEAIDTGTAHFDPSSLQWTTLDVGNPSTNVIPAEASGRFNIRFNDLWTAETLAAEIRARIARAAPQAVVTFAPSNAPAFLTAPGAFTAMMADAIESVTGRRPALSTTGGTSDARFIKDVCPVIEFGLVGQTMHAIDERVAVADLQALQAIYESAITRFFAASSSPS